MTKVRNPILPGFHPDPCICRAEGRYYLITSTFEWYPGVALYESDDLATWRSRGGILHDIDLRGIPDSAGIWAPSLTWDGERFYLMYTMAKQIDGYFKDVENYVVTAEHIEGPWSSPVYVNASGFDPAMYHEDGRHYVVNPMWDPRPLEGHRKFNGLILQEFDFERGMVGESKVIFPGSPRGGCEGPHIFKKDGWYYLLTAVGGTGRHHSITVARAADLWGPYEVSPYDPLITSWEKETKLKKSGHGNFVETPEGRWYMVHLCGRYLDRADVCPLGRETAIQEISWTDGWPRMIQGDCVPADEVEVPDPLTAPDIRTAPDDQRDTWHTIPVHTADVPAAASHGSSIRENTADHEILFRPGVCLETGEWLTLRGDGGGRIRLEEDGLHIRGGDSLTSLFDQSMIARRWTAIDFTAETALIYRPCHYLQTAGLACYYNTKSFYYMNVSYDEKSGRRVLSVLTNDNMEFSALPEEETVLIGDDVEQIWLKAEVHQERLTFSYALDQGAYSQLGPALDTSILSDEHAAGWAYTGAMIGITAVDNFNRDSEARFLWFRQNSTSFIN